MMNVVLMSEQMCCSRENLRLHHVISRSKWVIECERRRLRCICCRHWRTSSTILVAASRKPASVGQSA